MESEIFFELDPARVAKGKIGSSEADISRVFQALSNPTRRAILRDLAEGPKSVTQVVDRFALAQPTISRHLAILLEADLVFRRREGQRVLFSLNRELMLEVGSIPMRVSRHRRSGRVVAPW